MSDYYGDTSINIKATRYTVFPWLVGTTAVFFSTLPLSNLLLSVPQYSSSPYSPSVSCPLEVIPGSCLSLSGVFVFPLVVSASGTFSGNPTYRLPLRSSFPLPVTGALVSWTPYIGCWRLRLPSALGLFLGLKWARWSSPCNTWGLYFLYPPWLTPGSSGGTPYPCLPFADVVEISMIRAYNVATYAFNGPPVSPHPPWQASHTPVPSRWYEV